MCRSAIGVRDPGMTAPAAFLERTPPSFKVVLADPALWGSSAAAPAEALALTRQGASRAPGRSLSNWGGRTAPSRCRSGRGSRSLTVRCSFHARRPASGTRD